MILEKFTEKIKSSLPVGDEEITTLFSACLGAAFEECELDSTFIAHTHLVVLTAHIEYLEKNGHDMSNFKKGVIESLKNQGWDE